MRLLWSGICLVASIAAPASAVAQAAPSATPSTVACSASEHGALDFWVGEWDVIRPDTGLLVARSKIDKLHGCVIREQWMPMTGAGGSSLSHYDGRTRQWRQLWLDGTGGRVEFAGGSVGETVVLTGHWPGVNGPGQDGLIRMTYSRLSDGGVRQRGDLSIDHGVTWTLNFMFDYRRRTL